MAGLFTRAALADDLYRQRQREREDREFELLKRRDEQARLAQKEYLRPFETKELQAQFEDSMTARKDRDEQKVLTNWITPYQPSVGMNDDGTRQLDAKVPTDPAIAGLMAAGLGNAGGALDGLIQPFREQLGSASLKYNTPEEIKAKADLQEAHNKNLELIQARKKDEEAAHKRALELTRARAFRPSSSGRSSSSGGSSQQSQGPAYKADKRFNGMFDKIFGQYVSDYMRVKGTERLTEDEFALLGEEAERAAAGALGYRFDNTMAQVPPEPIDATAGSVSGPDPFALHEQIKTDAVAPHTPAPSPAAPTSLNDDLTALGAPSQLRQAPQALTQPDPEPMHAPESEPAAAPQDMIPPFVLSSAAERLAAVRTTKETGKRLPKASEAQQRAERASRHIAQAKEVAWVENFHKLAAAAERQLGRSLSDDERHYLIEAAQTGGAAGMADGKIDWDNATYVGADGKRTPIADVFNSYDFRLKNWFNDNALNKGFRQFEDYLGSTIQK